MDSPSISLPDSTLNASWMTHSVPLRTEMVTPGDKVFSAYFVGDLARWVAATAAPTNPVSHVPSDEEIQHQARWIMYNDGDPWNQTPADVPEWLWRFKRDVGIVNERHGEVSGGQALVET
ncbi:hypothetical protein N0V95_004603 [Ascochyta clinopodiicola]|nr:hypothetical protein N0V95_004603 [Ascochyta clinopodiicola]